MTGQRHRTPIETLSLYPPHGGTIGGLLTGRARDGPERPFLVYRGEVRTYGETVELVARAARALRARGITKGDRVAVMAPNSDAHVVLFLALAGVGAVLVPVNPEFGAAEAAHVFDHATVSAVACTADTLATARAACAGLAKQPWFVLLDGTAPDVPTFTDLLNSVPPGALPEDVTVGDTCLIMYTSGTTGFPKGVMHSQRNFVLAGEGFVERMHLQPDDRLFVVLPLFHINALFYSLGGALAAGASLLLTPRFSASAFWRTAAEGGATEVNILAAVGTILARRPRSEFVPGHRIVKLTGAPIPPEVAEVFRDEFGIGVVIEGYGLTEVPGVCNTPFDGPYKPGSLGRPARHPDHARPFAEMRVVDESGAELPDGAAGELLVRSPVAMSGYYRDPEQTARAFYDGWFRTGDVAYRDADGFFYFVARKKDIIRRRGENISGAEIDRVVGAHPKVQEVAAVAVASELGEDELLVALVAKPDTDLTAEEIADWCALHLAPHKRPRYVALLGALPHTPTHRVAKFKLRGDPTLLGRAVDLQRPERRAP
jgi:crotonobetaine/carnitine-CoA ligase